MIAAANNAFIEHCRKIFIRLDVVPNRGFIIQTKITRATKASKRPCFFIMSTIFLVFMLFLPTELINPHHLGSILDFFVAGTENTLSPPILSP